MGPANVHIAKEYAEQLKKIFGEFREILEGAQERCAGHDNPCLEMANGQDVIPNEWSYVDTILKCIWELTCVTLCQSFEPDKVYKMDPEADIPIGRQVRKLPEKKIKAPIREHYISLFNINTATSYMLSCVC